jgi:hypothetical protein
MSEHSSAAENGMREEADRRFATALQEAGIPDPRERYRQWLRELRERDEPAFRKALEYYEQHLVPAVANTASDPFAEWTEYGLRLAQRLQRGAAVRIDASGLSHPADGTAPLEDLVLHLPTSTRERALAVRLPAHPSPAQEATCALLVRQELG